MKNSVHWCVRTLIAVGDYSLAADVALNLEEPHRGTAIKAVAAAELLAKLA